MYKNDYQFSYDVFDSEDELSPSDAALLKEARGVTANAYAPYSQFRVGAAGRTVSGKLVTGTNQENASYPVGICAERVLLSAASSIYPADALDTIAISYDSSKSDSNHPVAPCGMCRQSLKEAEDRFRRPVRLILAGMTGKIFVVTRASMLLPLSFGSEELG